MFALCIVKLPIKMYLYILLSVGLVTMPSCSEALENLLLVFC